MCVEQLPQTHSVLLFVIRMINGCWDMARGDNVLQAFLGNRSSRASWWGDLSDALEADVGQVFPASTWLRNIFVRRLRSGRVKPRQETDGTDRLGHREASWESISILSPFYLASLLEWQSQGDSWVESNSFWPFLIRSFLLKSMASHFSYGPSYFAQVNVKHSHEKTFNSC